MNKNKLSPNKTQLFKLPKIARVLLKDEAIGGKLILVAAVLAFIAANTGLLGSYENFWQQRLNIGINQFVISLDLRHWVSEGLMAIFFLVVGLEIKREFVKGELRHIKTAALPIGAAVGGMVLPAVLFFAFNLGQSANLEGWAIPIATDIAFALGVISLLGRRIPSSLRLFLLTLAIADDLGAITVIALFYGSGLSMAAMLVAVAILIGLYAIKRTKIVSLPFFVLGGLAVWVAMYKSGVHPSIAGALLGFIAPLNSRARVAERLERLTIPVSTFLVVPLFAFSSLGIALSVDSFTVDGAAMLSAGIIAGLVVGKVAGISLASWLLVRLNMAELPRGTNWLQIIGVGLLAGIGFTVSIFITELAFTDSEQLTTVAKISVMIASTISAVLGYFFLRYRKKVATILG